MEHIPAPVFFRSIVEHDLGEVHGDSCWLFADGQLGKHKLVTKVAPHNILLLAAELHETCSSLGVAAAKLDISDDLLLVLYVEEGADYSHIGEALDYFEFLSFQPYAAIGKDEASVWLAWSSISNSPAVPFHSWMSGNIELPEI